ncbi:hypothetical protein RRG08_041257 [Elysia crispata]|uniref:Peptidase S1 domain-containing protein n=1 Tax=Elysia crispata TaxID=231223 RepID=A0AAE0Z8J6_9GAST|nr:hypothetical protein RRG08_041257 [Elysia crispata]
MRALEQPTQSKIPASCGEACYHGFNKCYILCKGARDIRAAAIECVRNGATILNIELPGEKLFISQLLIKKGFDKLQWYVGGKHVRGRWYWFYMIEKKRRVGKPRYRSIKKPMFPENFLGLSSREKKKCMALSHHKGEKQFFLKKNWCRKRVGMNFVCQKKINVLPVIDSGVCGKKMVHSASNITNSSNSTGNIIQKIVGSSGVTPGEHPWQARLMIYNAVSGSDIFNGGATILSEYWLLTAAHCLNWSQDRFSLRVVVGDLDRIKWDEGEQMFEVAQVIKHPRYKIYSFDYDIALIKVKPQNGRGILFNQYVQPACLPSAKTDYKPGLKCSISGWGKTTYNSPFAVKLRAATIPLVDKSTCERLVNHGAKWRVFRKRRMICAGFPTVKGFDSSEGDSGGPLVCPVDGLYTVMGVTAFGKEPHGENPGVYSSVQAYLPWINKTIKRKSRKIQKSH